MIPHILQSTGFRLGLLGGHEPGLMKFRCLTAAGWLGGVMVRASDLQSSGRGFDSWPDCYQGPADKASCSHPCASVTKQYNLVPVKGR